MFSGIIQATAPILVVQESNGVRRVRIKTPRGWKLKSGQSIAVDGICSTVVKFAQGFFEVEYMPETISKSTVESFAAGTIVNLERSMRLGETLDGHFVAGHVDARVRVAKIEKRGNEIDISISLPRPLKKLVAAQGSIAVSGVALTIASLSSAAATVALIPYTLAHTNLGSLKKGDTVNIEVDMLARYVAALLKT